MRNRAVRDSGAGQNRQIKNSVSFKIPSYGPCALATGLAFTACITGNAVIDNPLSEKSPPNPLPLCVTIAVFLIVPIAASGLTVTSTKTSKNESAGRSHVTPTGLAVEVILHDAPPLTEHPTPSIFKPAGTVSETATPDAAPVPVLAT